MIYRARRGGEAAPEDRQWPGARGRRPARDAAPHERPRPGGPAGRDHARRDVAQRGQSLVELAIIIPVALLLFAGALDMGRLFFARVSVENAAREGAMFGATNPRCDTAARSSCNDPNTAQWRTLNEATGLDGLATTFTCYDGATPRASVADCDQGDTYVVTVTDQFDFLTPILVPILGQTMMLEASASASVLNSAIDPSATFVPYPPTPTPTPSPTPDCTVPDFVGVRANAAQSQWGGAGFTGPFTKIGNGNFTIAYQDLGPGSAPCDSPISVYQVAP